MLENVRQKENLQTLQQRMRRIRVEKRIILFFFNYDNAMPEIHYFFFVHPLFSTDLPLLHFSYLSEL